MCPLTVGDMDLVWPPWDGSSQRDANELRGMTMRLDQARIAPLAVEEIDPELLALMGPRFKAIPVLNIFRTLTRR